ncbi:MAG: hypothetical protein JSU68_00760 [Phycisphaerales bacterium]|nr:MAG: hypothetical protein JSU68_00760 [Phycisphaerales bacterium]
MPVTTILASGPPNSGKTQVLMAIAASLLADDPPHHVRFIRDGRCAGTEVKPIPSRAGIPLRGCWQVPYNADLAFEILPEAIHRIRNRVKYVTMLLEADADPSLRYAYGYTHRIFCMAAPSSISDVFRSPRQALRALQEVLDDTAAFAAEIFGLFGSELMDEIADAVTIPMPSELARRRGELSAAQMRRFLSSPLGAEIASRIQLQPLYHSLAESDCVVINTGREGDGSVLANCVRRLGTLLNRVREGTGKERQLFICDPSDAKDPGTAKLMARLKELLSAGR